MSQNKITLTKEQADAFGRELDIIKEREMADLGEEDAEYIRRMIKIQRGLEVGGRALLFLPRRRVDLSDRDPFMQNALVIAIDVIIRRLNVRAIGDCLNIVDVLGNGFDLPGRDSRQDY